MRDRYSAGKSTYSEFKASRRKPKVEGEAPASILQVLLDKYGVSRQELAYDVGVSEPTIRSVINGIMRDGERVWPRILPETLESINKTLDRYEQEGRKGIVNEKRRPGRPRQKVVPFAPTDY